MRAVVQQKYGGPEVLELGEVPRPVLADQQVLIKVHASSVNPLDAKVRSGDLKFLTGNTFPKVIGADFAGEILEVPASVTGFKVGERVWGMVDLMGRKAAGANSEFAAVPVRLLNLIPESVSFAEAGCLGVGGITALYVLRSIAPVRPGMRVLVNGATGGVGTFAVQVGKLLEAHVTAVCHSRNADFARELGADEVLPYDAGDFRAAGKQWDVIFDVASNTTYSSCGSSLSAKGSWVTLMPSPGVVLGGPIWGLFTGKRAKICLGIKAGPELANEAMGLVAARKLKVHITQSFPLAELGKAHAALDRGARGKIAVQLVPPA